MSPVWWFFFSLYLPSLYQPELKHDLNENTSWTKYHFAILQQASLLLSLPHRLFYCMHLKGRDWIKIKCRLAEFWRIQRCKDSVHLELPGSPSQPASSSKVPRALYLEFSKITQFPNTDRYWKGGIEYTHKTSWTKVAMPILVAFHSFLIVWLCNLNCLFLTLFPWTSTHMLTHTYTPPLPKAHNCTGYVTLKMKQNGSTLMHVSQILQYCIP